MRHTLFILARLTDADVDILLSEGRRERVPPGHNLVSPGIPVDAFHIILSGCFEVRAGARGDVVLRRMHRGEIVGEISFLDHRPPSASVVATEPSVTLHIPTDRLQRRLDQDEGFASRFYRSLGTLLAFRVRDLTEKHAGSASGDEDLLDLDVLDRADLAARRFDRLMARLDH
ncbi:MAG: cyclic nucleotide-binding domain-containing protein [Myxococcales bacterium]|nr:cyclic nucleotide-binding domain-containing protein [Myxococcales bacterium]